MKGIEIKRERSSTALQFRLSGFDRERSSSALQFRPGGFPRERSSSALQFRPGGFKNGFARVESNISRNRRRSSKGRIISIDNNPTMLLPKARVRKDYDIYNIPRPFSVIPAEEYHHLCLSSAPEPLDYFRSRTPIKPLLEKKSQIREPKTVESSLKRSVTFEDLSHSRPDSRLADSSVGSADEHGGESDIGWDNLPLYIDSYADDRPINISPTPRTKFQNSNRPRTPSCPPSQADALDCACSICKVMFDKARMQKYFTGVNSFLKWISTKWGKVSFLQAQCDINRGPLRP